MTLEEAMEISNRLLPEESGGGEELARWQAQRPQPEPPKPPRSLDTAPAPEVDWAAVIRQTILGERAFLTEAIGGAIAEYGDSIIGEVEQMIAQAANQVRSELPRSFSCLPPMGMAMRNIRNEQIRAEAAAILRSATIIGLMRRALDPTPIANDPREPDHVKMARPVKKEAASPFHPPTKRQIAAGSAELLHHTRIKTSKTRKLTPVRHLLSGNGRAGGRRKAGGNQREQRFQEGRLSRT